MQQIATDVISLAAKRDFSRRGFVMTGLVTGFTLATARGPAAQTITTDTNGLEAGEVKFKSADGFEVPAYRAAPASGGPFPTVLVLEEIFGVHEHIKDVCRRFAKLGYYAIAPEIYARTGFDFSKATDVQTIIKEAVSKTPDPQILADHDAAVAFAKASGKADVVRLGVTGFCRGGRNTWLYAEARPNVKAAVAWYGGNIGDYAPKVMDVKCPVLALYGAEDQGIPVAEVEKLRDAAKSAPKPVEIVIYPSAPHGFNADYRPTYRKEAADDGWKRLQEWFKKYGAA